MSLTDLIDDLTKTSANLRTAMQGADIPVIEDAVDAFCASFEAVRAIDNWPADPELRAKFTALQPELEQSRALACLLADMTGQMQELAASRAPRSRQQLYGRTGERFG